VLNLALVCVALVAPQAGPSSVEAAFERFEHEHGAGWRLDVDEGTGQLEFLFGKSLAPSFEPHSEREWFTLAREALARTQELFGIEPQTLVEERVLFLPLGMVGTSDKWTVSFAQRVNGVPVEQGSVNVLFDARGRMLAVQAHALPGIAGLDTRATVSREAAVRVAKSAFAASARVDGELRGEPRLVVAQVEREGARGGVLAWRVDVAFEQAGAEPEAWSHLIDAHAGALVGRDTLVHHFDVSGTLRTRATPGVAPDTGSNPATETPLAYTLVTDGTVSVFSDAQGHFTLPGISAPVQVTVGYDGTFNNVIHATGNDYTGSFLLSSATGNVVVLNAPASADVTAQANVAVEVVRMRDWIRSVNPFDATADFVHTAYVNLAQTCNAYYSGGAINFFSAGGGCVNTAYSTVIGHEDGHWLNDRYGTFNGGDGMGEGNADVFAMFLADDPIVGRNFCGNGCHIRSGDNLRQFCGDCCGACYGEVHADGETWMGAAWKIRRNFNLTLGNAAGDALADALFLGWMNAYNQTTIRSVIEAQWLALDDDDGDLLTGTPHFGDIDAAFRQQGFPGVALPPVHVGSVSQATDTLDLQGPYAIEANVYANPPQGLATVELFYRTQSGAFTALAMTQATATKWVASIPGATAGRVHYFVRATTAGGATDEFPASGAAVPLFFNVGPTTTVFADRFEQDFGWSVVDSAPVVGSWVRGIPLGTILGTRTPQASADSADAGLQCWFTGQGTSATVPDEADVDGGPTMLVSPPVDLAGEQAELRYSYWMFSSGAGADTLVVELSPDGVQWTQARAHVHSATAGWRTERIDLGAHIVPGAATRVRFVVADNPNNSITEAALDDVRFVVTGTNACGMPQVFCTPKVNSQLCAPAIAFTGYPTVSGPGPFTISVSQVLNNRTGLLFYGYGTASKNFQGGTLCCRTPVRRTALQSTGGSLTGSNCTGTLSFDMHALLASGSDSNLVPGATVAAQYYYRDPQDAHGVGLSDAVLFVVCP
jgi:hypothetical protein